MCIEIVADTKKIYDTSNYDQKGRFQPLTTRKNIKLLGLIKDGMGGRTIRRVNGLYMLWRFKQMIMEKERECLKEWTQQLKCENFVILVLGFTIAKE